MKTLSYSYVIKYGPRVSWLLLTFEKIEFDNFDFVFFFLLLPFFCIKHNSYTVYTNDLHIKRMPYYQKISFLVRAGFELRSTSYRPRHASQWMAFLYAILNVITHTTRKRIPNLVLLVMVGRHGNLSNIRSCFSQWWKKMDRGALPVHAVLSDLVGWDYQRTDEHRPLSTLFSSMVCILATFWASWLQSVVRTLSAKPLSMIGVAIQATLVSPFQRTCAVNPPGMVFEAFKCSCSIGLVRSSPWK